MLRTAFFGSSSIGVFTCATDDVLLVRNDVEDDLREELEEELDVPAIATTIGGSSTVGALCVGNSKGLLVSSRITAGEREAIAAVTDLPVTELPGRINAAGNVVLANDTGAYVHPDLSHEAVRAVKDGLGVSVERGELAGLRTIGSAAGSSSASAVVGSTGSPEAAGSGSASASAAAVSAVASSLGSGSASASAACASSVSFSTSSRKRPSFSFSPSNISLLFVALLELLHRLLLGLLLDLLGALFDLVDLGL